MKERINWIDWAKAIAVTTVVFCHLPQSQEWFYYRYLQSVIIVIFFFLSGYLKKDRGSDMANWQKYSECKITEKDEISSKNAVYSNYHSIFATK